DERGGRGGGGQPGLEEIRDGETTKRRYRKAAEPTAAQWTAVACTHPSLKGEGRTAEGSPGWGDSGAGDDGDAVHADALPPPPGPLTRADLPPPEGGGPRQNIVADLPAWLIAPAPAESARSIAVSPSSAYDEAV